MNWSDEDVERYTPILISQFQDNHGFKLEVEQVFNDYFANFKFNDDRADFVIQIDKETANLLTNIDDAEDLDSYEKMKDIVFMNIEHFHTKENE